MTAILQILNLEKTYQDGFQALKKINLSINKGEIFALLGPNGAGKTTLINAVCGIIRPSAGSISVAGFDHQTDYRKARQLVGLVPQELTTDAFESVWDTVNFSRGLFGLPKSPDFVEKVLKDLSLWDKKKNRIMTLSGGMKRRVMIAKALAHEPKVLFLDEPTAGVDVELRQNMWEQVRALRERGVTVILTTHYIDEAEEMADRIGVINRGELVLVEDKKTLIKKMGAKNLTLDLREPVSALPESLSSFNLQLEREGHQIVYTYDAAQEDHRIAELLKLLEASGLNFKDLNTKQSSLEEIFVQLVRK